MKKRKRILICPLDWGLGHASRCIPIIRELIGQQFEVVVASDKHPITLLKQEFPYLEFIRFEGNEMRYAEHFFWLKMLWNIPRLAWSIFREHQQLKAFVKTYRIDFVISDNRYGCWSSTVPSIFITHQIFIRTPLLSAVVRKMNFWFLNKYAAVWIPDYKEEPNFSGKLSHGNGVPQHAQYIGILSKFMERNENEIVPKTYELCIILSGPEPQRSILEELLLIQLKEMKIKVVLVRGLPDSTNSLESSENLFVKNHLSATELERTILASEIVLCRSGYSSIMDLARLRKKAIFIPTPGQTEQEYLADYFQNQKICQSQKQNNLDLQLALAESKNYSGFSAQTSAPKLSLAGLIAQLKISNTAN